MSSSRLATPAPPLAGALDRSTVGRRRFLTGAATLLAGCGGASSVAFPESRSGERPGEKRQAELWSFFDLPHGDPRSSELSGIAWDSERRILWAVQDHTPTIVALVPDRELRTWTFGERIDLMIDTDDKIDLEGIVALRDGFYVCSEQGPHLFELDAKGRSRGEIALPARFREARSNKSLESLTMSPDGRYLFTTNEAALERDGERATREAGTRVRILRLDRNGGPPVQFAYATDASPHEGGDWGVADLAAKSDRELFVLERGWAHGKGNTVRVYETSLDAHASCAEVDELTASSPILAKTLRVDIGSFCPSNCPLPRQPQPAAILDNYEGLAIGPTLPNGRPSLLLVSDDNGRADQIARVVVLAL